jgi:glucose-6-phosphate 1-dehydrogenase
MGFLVNTYSDSVFCWSQAAWEIFTPLLHDIDGGKLKSVPYKPGTRGPQEADELSKRMGYVQTHGYIWVAPTLSNI